MIRDGIAGRDRPERVVEGLQSFLCPIDKAEVVVHEAEEPHAIIDFLDAAGLTRQTSAEIDLLALEAQAATVGHDNRLVVKRIVQLTDPLIRFASRRIHLGCSTGRDPGH